MAADVHRDSQGAPAVTLVGGAASGYCVFSALWAASDAELDTLRQTLADHVSEQDASRIKLSFAPITRPLCRVLIGDGKGGFTAIASSATSGFPPYDAVFNLQLDAAQRQHAEAALRGEPGHLAAEYTAVLSTPNPASATFEAASSELLPWLRARLQAGAALRPLMDSALEQGLARVSTDASDDPSGHLRGELHARVCDEAARVLPLWLHHGAADALRVRVALDHPTTESIRALADIGAIFATAAGRVITGGRDAAN